MALIRGSDLGRDDLLSQGESSPASASPGSLSAKPTASEVFQVLALDLFALQFEANLPYRRLCIARGRTPKNVVHWTEIPAAPTEAYKDWDLTCLAPEERSVVFHSSGTNSQRASRHFHCPDSLSVYAASLQTWFQRHLLSDVSGGSDTTLAGQPMPQVTLTPAPATAPNSSLVHMLGVLQETLWSPDSFFAGRVEAEGAWSFDIDPILVALRQSLDANQPVLLMGTAFNFVHLLDLFELMNIRYPLAPGSRIMETGGYKGRSRVLPKEELHRRLVRHLGIPADHIISEYGMSELSSQAYDHTIRENSGSGSGGNVRRVFHFPPWARVRIISPETEADVSEGETGLIQVTDLANVASVLAVQTSDLGIRRGTGFELVGRAAAVEPRGCSLMTA